MRRDESACSRWNTLFVQPEFGLQEIHRRLIAKFADDVLIGECPLEPLPLVPIERLLPIDADDVLRQLGLFGVMSEVLAQQRLFEERAVRRLELCGRSLLYCNHSIADITIAFVKDEDLVADAELVEALGIELAVSGCDETVLAVVVP